MKTISTILLTLGAVLPHLVRASDSANYTITPASFVSSGGRIGSPAYAIDTSMNDIGISGVAASASYSTRLGYPGQLFEVSTLQFASVSTNLNEATGVGLNPYATLNDGTRLYPAILKWSTSGAVASVSPIGQVLASTVYTNTAAKVTGSLGNKTATQNFLVLDTNPDNYGYYAGDLIPDTWQVQYFGASNPQGSGLADATGSGQNNYFKYIAGLNPTNPTSVFTFKLAPVAGQARQKQITFSPRLTNRTYSVLYANTIGGTFSNLNLATTADNGPTRTITDTNATTGSRFYRVRISYP